MSPVADVSHPGGVGYSDPLYSPLMVPTCISSHPIEVHCCLQSITALGSTSTPKRLEVPPLIFSSMALISSNLVIELCVCFLLKGRLIKMIELV